MFVESTEKPRKCCQSAAAMPDMLMQNTHTGQFELYDISNNQITQAMASFAPSGGALKTGSPDTQAISLAAAPALASETTGLTAGGKLAPVTSL
jgi:hypothetical protein